MRGASGRLSANASHALRGRRIATGDTENDLLRRAIPFDSGPLDDEETAYVADALFAGLDSEEDDAGSREVWLLDPCSGSTGCAVVLD